MTSLAEVWHLASLSYSGKWKITDAGGCVVRRRFSKLNKRKEVGRESSCLEFNVSWRFCCLVVISDAYISYPLCFCSWL